MGSFVPLGAGDGIQGAAWRGGRGLTAPLHPPGQGEDADILAAGREEGPQSHLNPAAVEPPTQRGHHSSQNLVPQDAPAAPPSPQPLTTTTAPLLQQGSGMGRPAARAPPAPLHGTSKAHFPLQPLLEGVTSPDPAGGTPRIPPHTLKSCHPCPLPCGSAGSELLPGPGCPAGHFAVSFQYLVPSRSSVHVTPSPAGGSGCFCEG